MGTDIRAELSTKNRYWVERHRYYELKHFCLQYRQWKKTYAAMDGYSKGGSLEIGTGKGGSVSDRTEACAEVRVDLSNRMRMVEDVAKEAGGFLSGLLLRSVTEALSYECLNAQERIPCCKDTWYAIYRRFFWLLDQARK